MHIAQLDTCTKEIQMNVQVHNKLINTIKQQLHLLSIKNKNKIQLMLRSNNSEIQCNIDKGKNWLFIYSSPSSPINEGLLN